MDSCRKEKLCVVVYETGLGPQNDSFYKNPLITEFIEIFYFRNVIFMDRTFQNT